MPEAETQGPPVGEDGQPLQQMVVKMSQGALQVVPMGGAVGRGADGKHILKLQCVVQLELDVVLEEDVKRGIVKGLTDGIDLATPSDMRAEILKRP